jgi:DNA-binding transcriptional LysR family regulator
VVIEDRLVVVLPADHPLAREEAVTLRSLRRERFVAVARRTSVGLHDRLIKLCAAAGFSPDIALEVDDPDLLPVAVAGGLGVGLVASVSVAGRSTPGVVWRPVADAEATMPLVAVSARDGATAQTREVLLLVEDLRRRSSLQPAAVVDAPEDRPDGPVAAGAPLRLLPVHGPTPEGM